MNLTEIGLVVWTGLVWPRMGSSGELFWMWKWTCGFYRMLGNYRLAIQLVASRVVLIAIGFYIYSPRIQMPWSVTGLSSSWRKWIQDSWPPSWGSLKNDGVRYGHELVPWDWDPRKTALARSSSNYKLQIHPLVRKGVP
jgi:hypothetical protein